jgi:hypothetical protein
VQDVLCGMVDDPKGQQILADLQFERGFEPVTTDSLKPVLALMAAAGV